MRKLRRMSLYNELKRRNVFRVAIAYLAGAWLLIEVAGTLFPAFGVPDWGVRFVVIVAANTDAHDAYLRGRHLVVQRTRATIEGAVNEFERAITFAPDYVLAHAARSAIESSRFQLRIRFDP